MFTRAALSILLCLVAQAASAIAVVDTNVSAPDGKDVHADGPVTAQSTVTYQNGSQRTGRLPTFSDTGRLLLNDSARCVLHVRLRHLSECRRSHHHITGS